MSICYFKTVIIQFSLNRSKTKQLFRYIRDIFLFCFPFLNRLSISFVQCAFFLFFFFSEFSWVFLLGISFSDSSGGGVEVTFNTVIINAHISLRRTTIWHCAVGSKNVVCLHVCSTLLLSFTGELWSFPPICFAHFFLLIWQNHNRMQLNWTWLEKSPWSYWLVLLYIYYRKPQVVP